MALAIDLFCGLGGWTEGLLAEGYTVVGFDIERHVYGEHRYPAQLVVQDVLTIHGRQLKSAALIVASPPCQEFSYMAMPWTKAKQKIADYESGARDVKQLTALFDACFRIQREASEAAGRHIPMVVENVRGAQRWVGRAAWHFGSFYLWGDVPALMPIAMARKHHGGSWFNVAHNTESGVGRNPVQALAVDGVKVATMGAGWYPKGHPKHVPGLSFNGHALRRSAVGSGAIFTSRDCDGTKQHGSGRECFAGEGTIGRTTSSKSQARKMASAMIAKIPLVLSRHVAAAWHPNR